MWPIRSFRRVNLLWSFANPLVCRQFEGNLNGIKANIRFESNEQWRGGNLPGWSIVSTGSRNGSESFDSHIISKIARHRCRQSICRLLLVDLNLRTNESGYWIWIWKYSIWSALTVLVLMVWHRLYLFQLYYRYPNRMSHKCRTVDDKPQVYWFRCGLCGKRKKIDKWFVAVVVIVAVKCLTW